MQLLIRSTLLFAFAAALLHAQAASDDFESYRVEATLSGWLVDTRGTIRSGSVPVDLRSDLGVEQGQPTFTGRLDLKPARRHHIVVEGTPYRLIGTNTLSRTIDFHGTQYTLSETVASSAAVDYVFGGYQYDLLSRDQGHLGLFAGGAYVNASAKLQGVTSGITASESQTIGLPLAGLDFRAYLIPGSRLLDVNGNFQGMSFGSYGRFVKGAVQAGVSPLRFLAIEAGYMVVDADLQWSGGLRGVAPRFSGPIFSLRLRDR